MNNIIFKTALIKGEAGNNIRTIEKTATSGAVDTYTITLTDGSTTTFNVTNGSNIESITLTDSSGLVDTYTVTLTDGSTTTFEVRNGQDYTVPTNGMIYYDDDNALPEGYEVAGNFTDEILAGEASGNVASFIGLDNTLVKELVANIEPQQAGSGTPSPSNVRAISGFTECTVTNNGKNLLNVTASSSTINNVTFNINTNKSVTVTTNGAASATTQLILSEMTFRKGITYKLSGCPSGGGGSTYAIYVSGVSGFTQVVDNGSGATFTPSDDVTTDVRIIVYNGATLNNVVFMPMIRFAGNTDATFEPYKTPDTAEISFTSAGTVYGGTINFTTGKLTLDRAMVDMGTLTWARYAETSVFSTNSLAATDIKIPEAYTLGDYLCSSLDQVLVNASVDNYTNVYMMSTNKRMWARLDDSYTDATAFKTALSGVQFLYKLATPLEYTLLTDDLRTFEGVNNVTASTGTMQKVVYFKSSIIADIYERMLALENA